MPPTLTAPRVGGVIVLGVVVGLMGTGIHRSNPPFGVVLALAAAASAGVLVRAWTGPRGVAVLAAAVAVVIGLLAFVDPGGDVLIAEQGVGYAWCGSVLVVLAALALPRRWFSERQVGGAADREHRAP